MHKAGRWQQQVDHLEKRHRDFGVVMGGVVKFAHIPVDEPGHGSARSFDLWKAQIVADCRTPGDIDDLARLFEETRGQIHLALGQIRIQHPGLHPGYRHALGVDGVKAAQGDAHHQIAHREAIQSFATLPQI